MLECYICNCNRHKAKGYPNNRNKFDKFNKQGDYHTQKKKLKHRGI